MLEITCMILRMQRDVNESEIEQVFLIKMGILILFPCIGRKKERYQCGNSTWSEELC